MISSSKAAPLLASRSFRISLCATILGIVSIAVAASAGPRFGLLLLIGGGMGATLEGLGFGFAGPWRRLILVRNPSGFLAQIMSMALVALVAFPLLEGHPTELTGAHAPVGFAMVAGAYVFGICMQLLLGCGSGTLVNAGSGNLVAILALPFFAIGSFLGSFHLSWWTSLGSLSVITVSGTNGLLFTLAGLGVLGGLAILIGEKRKLSVPPHLWCAALIIAALALLHLVVAGQPWGVVYGLGLWAAKGVIAVGADVSLSSFWSAPAHQTGLYSSILTDVTSLTNLGLMAGAAFVTFCRGGFTASQQTLTPTIWVSSVVAGFLLGYSSRLAFGCNVGAFFSGITTGSLHGWVWFLCAFAGSFAGISIRNRLGMGR
ncbi:YeeE/YedE family protein [Candidatus Puniceispirillum sp.]|nr:YeeE/YedE family protein [Candidatus Puniceispirillum sp.]